MKFLLLNLVLLIVFSNCKEFKCYSCTSDKCAVCADDRCADLNSNKLIKKICPSKMCGTLLTYLFDSSTNTENLLVYRNCGDDIQCIEENSTSYECRIDICYTSLCNNKVYNSSLEIKKYIFDKNGNVQKKRSHLNSVVIIFFINKYFIRFGQI